MSRYGTALLICLALCPGAEAQTTYYVNGDCGNDEWSGLEEVCEAPDGPKETIRSAVKAAARGDLVLVAPGTYPSMSNAFLMQTPITVRSSEGPLATVIDGDDKSEAMISLHFFDAAPGVIEGFTITRFDAFPGPIALYNADILLIDCRFIDNRGQYGGAVFNDPGLWADITAINCVFQGNFGNMVGGLHAWSVEVINCTFAGNTNDGGAKASAVIAVADEDSLLIANSVFRGEPPLIWGYSGGPVTYCNVEGGYEGEGNIDADPLFVDAPAGDLRLLPGSPCIDAGDNTAVPEWVRTDIGGLERFIDDPDTVDTGQGTAPIVDMGAHEFQSGCYPDFTADGLLDLFDFLAYANAFNAGDLEADCDHGGGLDLFDFLCFVNAFNQGC